jgi:hypothetical protein
MNERIRQLAEQATETVKCGLNGTSTTESFNRKKFAELIVRECLAIAREEEYHSPFEGPVETKIKQHFGVEE